MLRQYNTSDADTMRRHIDGHEGKYSHLPKEGLLFPELLEPEPMPERPTQGESCAELVESGEQALLVNDWMANIVGQYVFKLLHRQPITTFLTFISADDLVVQSKRICREELEVFWKLHD